MRMVTFPIVAPPTGAFPTGVPVGIATVVATVMALAWPM
jgi:hypothetical protein